MPNVVTAAPSCRFWLLVLALLVGLLAPAHGERCNNVAVWMSSRPKGKAGRPASVRVGKRVTVVTKVKNTGLTGLHNVSVGVTLPNFLLPVTTKAASKLVGKPTISDTRAVYWLEFSLPAGKTRR